MFFGRVLKSQLRNTFRLIVYSISESLQFSHTIASESCVRSMKCLRGLSKVGLCSSD